MPIHTRQITNSSDNSKVTLFGAYPPPYGGISIHVMRLSEILLSSGFSIEIFDYTKFRFCQNPVDISYHSSTFQRTLYRLLIDTYLNRKNNIAHVHISAGERYLNVGLVFWLLTRYRSSILTVHSGRFKTFVKNIGLIRRSILSWFFRQYDAIVTVSVEQAEIMTSTFGVSQNKIHVIPAFLLPPLKDIPLVHENQKVPLIVASGFAESHYGFEILLKAVAKLRNSGFDFETNLILYTQEDPSYASYVRETAKTLGVKIFDAMEPDAFLKLLSRTHIFVRPTFVDGDSNAVREAHWSGAHVVASDCVQRPTWAHLFTTGNADSLTDVLANLLNQGRPGIDIMDKNFDDPAKKLLNLYRSLIN